MNSFLLLTNVCKDWLSFSGTPVYFIRESASTTPNVPQMEDGKWVKWNRGMSEWKAVQLRQELQCCLYSLMMHLDNELQILIQPYAFRLCKMLDSLTGFCTRFEVTILPSQIAYIVVASSILSFSFSAFHQRAYLQMTTSKKQQQPASSELQRFANAHQSALAGEVLI